jgi:hypothetical protein
MHQKMALAAMCREQILKKQFCLMDGASEFSKRRWWAPSMLLAIVDPTTL